LVPTVRVGTVVIDDDWPALANVVSLVSDPYCENWKVVRAMDGFALDRAICLSDYLWLWNRMRLPHTRMWSCMGNCD